MLQQIPLVPSIDLDGSTTYATCTTVHPCRSKTAATATRKKTYLAREMDLDDVKPGVSQYGFA